MLNTTALISKFSEALCYLGIASKEEKVFTLLEYFKELWQWNALFNLVGEKTFEQLYLNQGIDCLAIFATEINLEKQSVIDLGSGGGLPGVVLKIWEPSLRVSLVESNRKKVNFLNHIVKKFLLSDVKIFEDRIETLAHIPNLRESFSLVVAKALAPMSVLVEYALPFLLPKGLFVAYKGKEGERELWEAREAICLLGGKEKAVYKYIIPFSALVKRSLIIIEKTSTTPFRYPRKVGIPSKYPLPKWR